MIRAVVEAFDAATGFLNSSQKSDGAEKTPDAPPAAASSFKKRKVADSKELPPKDAVPGPAKKAKKDKKEKKG